MPNTTVHPYASYGTVPFDTQVTIVAPLLPSHIRQQTPGWQRGLAILVAVVSLLMLAGSIALFIAASHISNTLEVNPGFSKSVKISLWSTSGIAFFIFLVGMLGAVTKFRPLLCCFAFLLVPVIVAFITAGVMVLLLDGAVTMGDTWKKDTEGIWKGLVTASNDNTDHFLCQIQDKFSCSGFDTQQPGLGCCNPDLGCYDPLAPPSWVAEYCPTSCALQTTTTTCYSVFQHDIHKYVVGASFVCFGSASLLLCLCCISLILMCRRDRRLERINEYEYVSVPI